MPTVMLRGLSASAFLPIFALAVALAVISAGPANASPNHRVPGRAADIARAQAGDPYVYGADGPNAFDCSGLTSYAYKQAGGYLPRSSQMQWNYVRHIKKSNAVRGDLVFFMNGSDVYHVGILAGRVNGKAVIWHASRSGQPVKRDPVWTTSWRAGTVRHR